MAVGDGITWNESLPDNTTLVSEIDDYDRDLRLGVRQRMANEHIWPASQTGTGEAGQHKFITLQTLTGAPAMTTGMGGVIYATSGGGIVIASSGGTPINIVSTRTALWYIDGALVATVGQSARICMNAAGTFTAAKAFVDVTGTGAAILVDINKNGTTIFTTQGNRITIADGSTGGTGIVTNVVFTARDLFSLDIDAVGSGVVGSDLTVTLDFVGG